MWSIVAGLGAGWLLTMQPVPDAPASPRFGEPDTSIIVDPMLGTFDDDLGRSPSNVEAGDPTFQYAFRGTLRGPNGHPVPSYPAEAIELAIRPPCQNPIVLNPDGPSSPAGEIVWGAAKLDQAGGGSCIGSGVVEIRLVGLGPFKHLDQVTSPDQVGDGTVDVVDLVIWQRAFVNQGPDYQGDLDLDGTIAVTDLTVFQRHFLPAR
jgi:hypothetical protein